MHVFSSGGFEIYHYSNEFHPKISVWDRRAWAWQFRALCPLPFNIDINYMYVLLGVTEALLAFFVLFFLSSTLKYFK